MADADSPMSRSFGELLFEQVDPAGGFHYREIAVVLNGDDAGTVVPAILKAMETFDEKIDRFVLTNVSDNTAHETKLLLGEPLSTKLPQPGNAAGCAFLNGLRSCIKTVSEKGTVPFFSADFEKSGQFPTVLMQPLIPLPNCNFRR
jgi:hypothetical protein